MHTANFESNVNVNYKEGTYLNVKETPNLHSKWLYCCTIVNTVVCNTYCWPHKMSVWDTSKMDLLDTLSLE